MAKDWQIKKRRPVRRKHIAPLLKDLEEALGIDLAVDGAFLEMADYGPWKMVLVDSCLLYTSPSPRDISGSRMPSSA